jgi:putative transcriptional regulator
MIKKEIALKKLGQHIKKIRKLKGISQVELANSIGKDQQSIQRLEAGNVNPTFYYLCEISEGLEMNIEEVVKF